MTTVLSEAESIIYGDRERTYGKPGKNLEAIALFWAAYLVSKHGVAIRLSPEDVCAMMRLLKEARLMNQPNHRDSIVDLCGYAALQDRVLNGDPGREGETESPKVA